MEEILQVLSNLKMKCYVMGDFNVNLLHINENATTYINMFQCYSFSQIIIKPTRVTDRSATLIGHIWTNDMQNYIHVQGQNMEEMVNTLNHQLIKVSDWITSNRLTLNVSKTF